MDVKGIRGSLETAPVEKKGFFKKMALKAQEKASTIQTEDSSKENKGKGKKKK